MTHPGLLVLTSQYTSSGALLAQAAADRGMLVEQLPPCRRVPEPLRDIRPAHLYGGPRFTAAVAPQIGVKPLEPAARWLSRLPYRFVSRAIRELPLSAARQLQQPFFAKPLADKAFPTDVYASGVRLPGGLPDATPVQVSEIVTFAAEFRLFVLDGEVRTGSRYATFCRLDPAPLTHCPERDELLDFAKDLLTARARSLPRAFVLDLGLMADFEGAGPWAVVEAGPAWFSPLYASEAGEVLDVVLESVAPADEAN
ncbi:ATP-grasp domain-containing protein [Streptomyces sp. NPDC051776]|uniref:ATP-grasp domain-containing protein n=1 Tax=Streptomyces sp. NPDC051776 TaxID=3155414 RepID=UPI00341B6532